MMTIAIDLIKFYTLSRLANNTP